MLGAVQLGLIASCVVLFVPMGMAGWHLSRNKMLFFSGALFITLAVGVHLTPYFPSISHFVSSSVSPPALTKNTESPSFSSSSSSSCAYFLHDIVYSPNNAIGGPNSSSKTGSSDNKMMWEWAKSESLIDCGFQKFSRSDASDLLNGSWILIAGDSEARLIALALLSLVLDSKEIELVHGDLFKRHSDYHIVFGVIGTRLDFIWAPYVTNLTDLMSEYRRTENYPDVLVMGSGLWHMLHVTNASDYGASLGLLREASQIPFSSRKRLVRLPNLFWMGMPLLVDTMLNTEEKREKMNSIMQSSYNREVYKSKILRGFDGPFELLDLHLLSGKCGIGCTLDGMHYDGSVYEAAVHIMLNALLVESNQML